MHGRVQGVFFRASAREMARGLGLKGYVRNLPLGQVEMVLAGSPDKLQEALVWCRQGPPLAKVTQLQVTYEQAEPWPGFSIR